MEVAGRTCCKLRFMRCGWTANYMREFAVALPHFTKLQTLYLAYSDLQDEGAKILATVLKAPFVCQLMGQSIRACTRTVKLHGKDLVVFFFG